MTLTTSNGKVFKVESAFGPISTGELVIHLRDHRALSDIALDFDGCDHFHRESETEGDLDFDGYTVLVGINRTAYGTDRDRVTIMLAKEANDGN